MSITHFLTAAAAIGAIAVPAAAQTSYPYQYPQQGYGYPQQGYGYPQQGYGGGGAIEQVINQLLGNRYNVNDRTAVRQCASAAAQQASAQYGRYGRQGYGQQGYGQNYGYGQQGYPQGYRYNPMTSMRVTAITNVERRRSGLRVSGLLDSRRGYGDHSGGYSGDHSGGYGGAYQNQGHAPGGDLSFRCNVDYRGMVTNIRIRPNNNWRR